MASAAMAASVQVRHIPGQRTECSAQHSAHRLHGEPPHTSSKCGHGCFVCASPPPVGPVVPDQELLAQPAQLGAPMQHVEPHPQVVQPHGDLPPAGWHRNTIDGDQQQISMLARPMSAPNWANQALISARAVSVLNKGYAEAPAASALQQQRWASTAQHWRLLARDHIWSRHVRTASPGIKGHVGNHMLRLLLHLLIHC